MIHIGSGHHKCIARMPNDSGNIKVSLCELCYGLILCTRIIDLKQLSCSVNGGNKENLLPVIAPGKAVYRTIPIFGYVYFIGSRLNYNVVLVRLVSISLHTQPT